MVFPEVERMELKIKRIIRWTLVLLLIALIAGIGLLAYNSNNSYNISSGFTSVPLNYDPDTSTSVYSFNGTEIIVHNGFVKGTQRDSADMRLVIRALSPTPSVELKNPGNVELKPIIQIENINPVTYAASIEPGFNPARISVNTLEFKLSLASGETKKIIPVIPDGAGETKAVILGDNRDGYDTFAQIISQVNAQSPAFVIDNGDLVFAGKPNQYRLFDKMISGISTTVCTTLGNHDIRNGGREIYTKLYGPPYYSFDSGNNHYIFLDSSRGYAEMQAIPDEQYAWLERDLIKAQGKRIYVTSHVPSTDPRSGLKPNNIEAFTDQVEKEGGLVEQRLEAYSIDASIDHGFRSRDEAVKFEALMTRYKVNTVYLSHIHSYFDDTKDGVRYVISGGAGAELMTQNSYYHYLVTKTGSPDTMIMVQLPSPPNLILQRYGATIQLFANAMYRENQAAVTLLIAAFALLILLLILSLILKFKNGLTIIGQTAKDTWKFMIDKYRELRGQKTKKTKNHK